MFPIFQIRFSALALFSALILAAPSCQTVPGTGRSQLNVFSVAEEQKLGGHAYREAMSESRVVQSGENAEMVKRIGRRIAAAAQQLYPDSIASRCRWQFNLIKDDDMVNAWAMPGGGCAVYTGLLPVAETENGLAVVMGHEVAHVIARHGGERMSHGTLLSIGMIAAQVKMRDMDRNDRFLTMAALGGFVTVGVMLPFSRSHESEADELGLYLCAAAGYDPQEAIPLWRRMEEASGSGGLEFLSTHPHPETRIEQFQELMPRALDIYHQSSLKGKSGQKDGGRPNRDHMRNR